VTVADPLRVASSELVAVTVYTPAAGALKVAVGPLGVSVAPAGVAVHVTPPPQAEFALTVAVRVTVAPTATVDWSALTVTPVTLHVGGFGGVPESQPGRAARVTAAMPADRIVAAPRWRLANMAVPRLGAGNVGHPPRWTNAPRVAIPRCAPICRLEEDQSNA
jgi:hypothetical protein